MKRSTIDLPSFPHLDATAPFLGSIQVGNLDPRLDLMHDALIRILLPSGLLRQDFVLGHGDEVIVWKADTGEVETR